MGFVARDVQSDIINVMSGALPGYGYHHLGIISRHNGELLLYESTTGERPPCYITGKYTGVAARPLEEMREFLSTQETQLWYFGLRSPLYADEEARLDEFLLRQTGFTYDMDGALHSGGGLLFRSIAIILRGEDLTSYFCSELCMAALSNVGRVQTSNVSKWSPNKSARYLVRRGVTNRPWRYL